MPNAVTSRTSAVAAGVVTHLLPGKASGFHLYLKYAKGGGTSVSIVLTFIDPNLSPTDEYQQIYFGTAMAPTALPFSLSASGNYRIPVPMPMGETVVKATVTFTGGSDQVLVLDIRGE